MNTGKEMYEGEVSADGAWNGKGMLVVENPEQFEIHEGTMIKIKLNGLCRTLRFRKSEQYCAIII